MITISFISEEEQKNLEEKIKKLDKQLCEQGHEPLFYYRVELLKELTEARLELGKAGNKRIMKLDDEGKLYF